MSIDFLQYIICEMLDWLTVMQLSIDFLFYCSNYLLSSYSFSKMNYGFFYCLHYYFNTRLTSMECSIDNRRAVILLAKLTGFWNDCFMFFRRSGSNFILNLEHLATHDISILNLQFSMFSDFPTLQYSIILIVSI